MKSRPAVIRHASRVAAGLFALLVLGGAVSSSSEAAQDEAAKQLVAKVGEELRRVVTEADKSTKAERLDALTEILHQHFDMKRVGASIVGPDNYGKWTDEQRRSYVDSFIRYMIVTNDQHILLFQGDAFSVIGSETMPRGQHSVQTEYRVEGQKPVQIGFVVGERQGEMRVLDVQEQSAISLLEVKRAELNSVLKRKGFDGLIELMNKIADKKVAE